MGLLDKLTSWTGRGGTLATVLVVGLDNSGKTTLVRSLREPQPQPQPPAPTVAHQHYPDHVQSGGVSISLTDVGGSSRHRALWERHYARANAVVFVVDAADALRLAVARDELWLMLQHAALRSRRAPLLVLANKSDAPHALPPAQVAAALGLERIHERPWQVCAGSARSGAGLPDGVAWLARQLRDQAK